MYTDIIISNWGGRLELDIDRKAKIWSRKQKIYILVPLQILVCALREIKKKVILGYFHLFRQIYNKKTNKKNIILNFYQ